MTHFAAAAAAYLARKGLPAGHLAAEATRIGGAPVADDAEAVRFFMIFRPRLARAILAAA